jgi:hypothetical protein
MSPVRERESARVRASRQSMPPLHRR